MITLPPPPAVEEAPPTPVTQPVSAVDVTRVQHFLYLRGFHDVPVDGVLGDATREAIRLFQGRHALPVTGEPDPTTISRLLRSSSGHIEVVVLGKTLGSRALVLAVDQLTLGVREDRPGSRRSDRIDAYGAAVGLPAGASWNVAFESWCRRRVTPRGETDALGYHASAVTLWDAAVTLWDAAMTLGLAHDPEWSPQPGDIAVLERDNVTRVGRVEKPGVVFEVVEGDCDGRVKRVSRFISDPDLMGWISCP